MTEVLFYHLTSTPLEATLPTLLQKSLERGWTVCIQGRGRDALDRLDRHLWTFDDARFLDGQYTVWGEVESGMDLVDALPKGEPPRYPGKIVKATVG